MKLFIVGYGEYFLFSIMSLPWTEIGLPIPNVVLEYSEELQRSIFDYLKQLGDNERKAYNIAFNHLGTSFNIVRSMGYVSWKKRLVG